MDQIDFATRAAAMFVETYEGAFGKDCLNILARAVEAAVPVPNVSAPTPVQAQAAATPIALTEFGRGLKIDFRGAITSDRRTDAARDRRMRRLRDLFRNNPVRAFKRIELYTMVGYENINHLAYDIRQLVDERFVEKPNRKRCYRLVLS